MRRSRSRSPLRLAAPSLEVREAILTMFAKLYWARPDTPDTPPWCGNRALAITNFRLHLVDLVESSVEELDLDPDTGFCRLSKNTVFRWQRFTFCEDVFRMSDVLFRGPIESRHSHAVDFRVHNAWRRLQATCPSAEEFNDAVVDFRVSAARVAMMLETARPPEANEIDGHFELPDARTLASLLSLRCEKDDMEELMELYRLICRKLEGQSCPWCGKGFDESSSAGVFDGAETLVMPATVPKLFVPHCGHAIHTMCFGSQLVPEHDCNSGVPGTCRRCGLDYAWTAIDVDPMVFAFCLLFGKYVEEKLQEMCMAGEVIQSAIVSIAEVCQNFSHELCGLLSPASVWTLLTKRHCFSDPEALDRISGLVFELLVPNPCNQLRPNQTVCIGPNDLSDHESQDGVNEHVTEVFLPDRVSDGEAPSSVPNSPLRPLSDEGSLSPGPPFSPEPD